MAERLPIPANPADAALERIVEDVAAATRMLADADVETAKEMRARASALALYMRQRDDSKASAMHVEALRLRAERKIGEVLRAHRPREGRPPRETRPDGNSFPTLAEQGIGLKESATFQRLAAVPAERFEAAVEEGKKRGRVSRSRVLRDTGAIDPIPDPRPMIEARKRVDRLLKAFEAVATHAPAVDDLGLLLIDCPVDLRRTLVDLGRHAAERARDVAEAYIAASTIETTVRRVK